MKIKCNTKELAEKVQIASAAVASKPVTTALGCLHFTAKGNLLKITGMDAELLISTIMQVEVEEAGSILIPAKLLSALLKKLSGEETLIQTMENQALIESSRSKSSLPLLDTAAYPPLLKLDKNLEFTVAELSLKELIQKSLYAVSTDPNKRIFTGVQVSLAEDKLQFCATNTHRIALKTKTMTAASGSGIVIVPAPVLRELAKLNSDSEEQSVKIGLGEKTILFATRTIQMLSRVIEGKFPDVKRVIPKSFKTVAKLSRKELLETLERIQLFANKSENNVIKFDFQPLTVEISSEQKETGFSSEALAGTLEGDPLKVAFNSRYIIEALKSMSSENIFLKLNSSLTPCCLMAEGEEDYINVITPIRMAP